MPRKGYVGLNLSITPSISEKMDRIIKKTSESKSSLVTRLIEKEYSILIDGVDPYIEYSNNMVNLDNNISENVKKLYKAINIINEQNHEHHESIKKTINSNVINLNENHKLLTRILNVCYYSFARIIKFSTLSLYHIIGFGENENNVNEFSKIRSSKATKKMLNQLIDSVDCDSNSLIKSFINEGD